MNRVKDLRADYDLLGSLLAEAEPAAAASIARERRLIGELLESLEPAKTTPVVDQLAQRRKSQGPAPRSAARRRQSG